jgi:predicted ferric reductase
VKIAPDTRGPVAERLRTRRLRIARIRRRVLAAAGATFVLAWGVIFVQLVSGQSYWVRRWIGYQRWKTIHRFTALVWLFGLVHTFTEGTDAGQLWFVALILLTAAPAAALLLRRLGWRRSPLVAAPVQR